MGKWKTMIIALTIAPSFALGCGGTDNPQIGSVAEREETATTHEGLSAAATQSRDAVRMQPAEIAVLRADTESPIVNPLSAAEAKANFEQAFGALETASSKSEARKRDLLVAAVDAVGLLPLADQRSANLRIVALYRQESNVQ